MKRLMKFLFLLCLPLWKYFTAIFIENEVYFNDNGKNTFSYKYIYSNESIESMPLSNNIAKGLNIAYFIFFNNNK